MTERTLYYWAHEYAAGIKEGEDYSGPPSAITINIVNFGDTFCEYGEV
jgi:hypothetical protein